nr:hypothetical protein [uncultured Mucilaginibacter sp.]
MKAAIIIFLCLATALHGYAQSKQQRLILAEYRVDPDHAGHYRYLVAYNFVAGKLVSKDTLLGAPTFKDGVGGSYVRYDLRKTFIYKNRYVIGGNSSVIDLKKKVVLLPGGQTFIDTLGDTLLFHRANSDTGTGYRHLNLLTGQSYFIDSSAQNRDRIERSSPDQKQYLSIYNGKQGKQIRLYDAKANTYQILIDDAGMGPDVTSDAQRRTVKTHWLNNHSFLYTVHRQAEQDTSFKPMKDVQFYIIYYFSDLTMHKYDILTKRDEVIFTLDKVKPGPTNDRFLKDEIGQTIYCTGSFDYYLIDTLKNRVTAYPFFELGNGFSVQSERDAEGFSFRYKGKEIKHYRDYYYRAVAGKELIAIQELNKPLNVWSAQTGEWTSIKIPWLEAVIGWVEE